MATPPIPRIALHALAAVLAACGALDDDPAPLDCANLKCVEADRPYSYQPTREARKPIGTGAPGAVALPESAYDDVESGPTHTVTFSADLMQVELVSTQAGEPLIGTRQRTQQDGASDRIAYDLDAFAGGEFIVSWDQRELGAELTLFGSGVPITSSNRGLLTPQRGND